MRSYLEDHDGGDEEDVYDFVVDTRGPLAAVQAIRREPGQRSSSQHDALDRLYRKALAEQAAYRRAA